MVEYHFRAELAAEYGVDGAIFLHCMAFWTAKNRANGRHFHEGRYWTYNTMKALTELFPFWSRRQIERIVAGLKEAGALLTGNFSEDKTDRTLWYALGDKVLEAYGEGVPPISPNGEMDLPEPCTPGEGAPPISPNGEMDFTEPCTPFPQTGKCIKGTVTYQLNTPYSPPAEKPRRRKGEKVELPEASRALLGAWAEGKPEALRAELENFVSVRMEEKKARHTPAAYKAILNRLDRFSGGSDEGMLDMLSLAASRGWITVYPPKTQDKPSGQGEEGRWDVE